MLHGPLGSRRWLFVTATACCVATFFTAKLGLDGFFFGLGVAALAVGLLMREPEAACGFCRRPRAQVRKLVAGPSVSICDDCLPRSLEVMLNEQPTQWALVVNALPAHTPRAVSTPLLLLSASSLGKDHLEASLRTCFDLENPEAARALLEGVPETERSSAQWINLGVALGQLGRYDDAIAATRRARDSEAWVLNNVVAFTLDAQPTLRDVQPLLDDVLRARTLLDGLPAATAEVLRASTLGTLAELHRRRGELDEALRCLDQAEPVGAARGWRSLTRARILLDQQRPTEAHAVLTEVASGHPESLVTLEAQRLLG